MGKGIYVNGLTSLSTSPLTAKWPNCEHVACPEGSTTSKRWYTVLPVRQQLDMDYKHCSREAQRCLHYGCSSWNRRQKKAFARDLKSSARALGLPRWLLVYKWYSLASCHLSHLCIPYTPPPPHTHTHTYGHPHTPNALAPHTSILISSHHFIPT